MISGRSCSATITLNPSSVRVCYTITLNPSWQTPWPLQSPGHAVRRQPSPLNPGKHSHSPDLRSHLPLPEHSNFCLWSLSSCGAAAHAYPDGQVRKEQSAPVHAATVVAVAYSWF